MTQNDSIFPFSDTPLTLETTTQELFTLVNLVVLAEEIVNAGLVVDPGDEFFDVLYRVFEKMVNLIPPANEADVEDNDGKESGLISPV
jgi:hypothetical protein